ncbi:zinc finger protein 616-like [Cylas formicarius]|uniref:zinc finger protein 616-like n=1 Tax=Cylas formicarius TaxID=197179 RepID=UPI0029583624|nr:zinc finger protein 616-like [Cylas formicarius]
MSGYKRVNFYELCRLCAQSIQKEKTHTHIFREDGKKIQLQNKIKSCLSITVKEDDFLPKVVCSKCIKQLEVCNLFREECVTSETMLSSYFKNFRQTEDFKKSGKVYIKDTVSTVATTSEVSSTNINLSTVPSQNVLNLKPSPLEGQFYAVQLPSTAANTTKLKTEKQAPQFQSSQQQMAYNMNLLNAAIKSTVQQLPKELLSNVLVNSNGEVINITQPCDLDASYSASKGKKCDKSKKPSKEADENVVKIDLTHESELFGEKRDGLPHIKSTPQPQKFNSNAAPTVIFPLSEFQNGYASYQGSAIYSQQSMSANNNLANVICNTSELDTAQLNPDFNTTTTYASLSNVIHQTPALAPPVANSDLKNDHQSNKQEPTDVVKPHACDICLKSFKRREHLYQHIKLHTGFRPYKCTQCSKSFMRKEHLLRHMTLHSGIRNYECDICNKCFSRNDNLLKHKKTHDKQSSYTCEVCRKVFVMKHYYQAHKNTHGKCFAPTYGDCKT